MTLGCVEFRYLQDRSATIREAMDILQEVSFRQLVKTRPDESQTAWMPLSNTYSWELLFHEAMGGAQKRYIFPGECVRAHKRAD